MSLKDEFCEELVKIYKFKEAFPVGLARWDRCFQYHEPGTDFYVEVLLIGSTYIVREQRGEDVLLNYYIISDRALERLDLIL